MNVDISTESYGSPIARPLTDAREEELLERYAGDPGSGGEPDPAVFAAPDGVFLVGHVDGAAAACGGLCRFDSETAEIRRMYVAPIARGRGVGRLLLGRLLEAARERAYR